MEGAGEVDMPDTTESRLAVLETKVDAIDTRTQNIEEKLDKAISCKADLTAVQAVDGRVTEVRGWLWGLVIAVGVSLLGALISLLAVLARM